MQSAEVIRFASDAEIAKAAATALLDDIAKAQHGPGPFCVALSGGRIAKALFASIIEQSRARSISLANVHFFWADERCVPPNDAESSFRVAHECLFEPLKLSNENIHRIHGEESPEFAARQAEAEICRIAPLNDDGQPILDLVILGMGEDGHVASLFPREPATIVGDKQVYRPIFESPKPPPNRVTLGYLAIAAARQVWVLANGAGKAAALKESLKPDGQTPLARVLRLHPRTKVYTDIP